MSAAIMRSSWPLFAIPFAVVVALIGMVVAGVWHVQIGRSPLLSALIALSFLASLIGAVGGLVLALDYL